MSYRIRGLAPFGVAAVLALAFGPEPVGAQPAGPRSAPSDTQAMPALEGRMIQGGLLIGHAVPGTRVRAGNRPIGVARDGTFLVGLPMDAPESLELTVTPPDGASQRRILEIEQREYPTDRIENLPDEEVNPTPEMGAAMRRAHAQLDRIRRRITPEAFFTSGFDWPARGRITSPYGVRRVLNGEPRAPHNGVDIAVPIGTPVRAPAGGVVVFTSEDIPLAGKTIVVNHGLGLSSTFLHLSSIAVRPGDRVQKGDTLGRSGETGRATGPHLEWDVHLRGMALDPALLIEAQPSTSGQRGAARDVRRG